MDYAKSENSAQLRQLSGTWFTSDGDFSPLHGLLASDVITHSAHPAGPHPGASGRKHRSWNSPTASAEVSLICLRCDITAPDVMDDPMTLTSASTEDGQKTVVMAALVLGDKVRRGQIIV